MYRAKIDFVDLQDGRYLYKAGDEFPRNGYTPDKERITALLGVSNRAGRPLIEEIPGNESKVPEKAVKTPTRGRRKKNAD